MTSDRAVLTLDNSSGYERSAVVSTSGTERTNIFFGDQNHPPSLEDIFETKSIEALLHLGTGWLMAPVGLRDVPQERVNLVEAREMYHLENASRVRDFLRNHPQVIDLLLEAQGHIEEHFGSGAEVVLEVVSRADGRRMEQLVAYILTEEPIEEAFARLKAFGKEWFTSQFVQVDGRVNFDVVCV